MALFAAASLLALMGLALVYASREVRLGPARSAREGGPAISTQQPVLDREAGNRVLVESAVVGNQSCFEIKSNRSDRQVDIRFGRAAPPELRLQGSEAPRRRVTEDLKRVRLESVLIFSRLASTRPEKRAPYSSSASTGGAENDVL